MFINNHNLHIESYGPEDSPVVVLLHHGLGSTRAWHKQVPNLLEGGYRVIVYDRWGYGRSDRRESLDVPGFETDIADLKTLLDNFDVNRAILVGHSDGGTLALYFVIKYPERVSALVTVAAHIYLERSTMEPSAQAILQAFRKDDGFRKGMHIAHGDNADAVIQCWFDSWHTAAALDWDMRPILNQITCPTLVIQGEKDEYTAPQHAIDIADNIPDADLCLVEGATHMLPQDQPELFNQRLLRFLMAVRDRRLL